MKIFIEGTPLFSNSRSGVGQYAKRLTEAMIAINNRNEYTLFGFHFLLKGLTVPKDDLSEAFKRKYIRLMPGRGYNLLYKKGIRLPIDILLRSRPDVVFYSNFVHWPLWTRAKSVIAIHDLGYIDLPQYVDKKNRKFLEKFVPYSIKRADHIITISEYSKQQVMKHFSVDENKISIVMPAIDSKDYYPRTKAEVEKVKKLYKLPKNYLLFVSTLEPRKNVTGLLDAFAALPIEIQNQYPLILVGGKGWADEEILERLERYKNLPIIRPGYVNDEYMASLYSGATALVFPTNYEGFGMPPLEAMACGTPVITSSTTSLPEVVGSAAISIDPSNTKEITKAIETLVSDKGLQRKLSAKGLKQARKFSWEKSAKKALEVFESLM